MFIGLSDLKIQCLIFAIKRLEQTKSRFFYFKISVLEINYTVSKIRSDSRTLSFINDTLKRKRADLLI